MLGLYRRVIEKGAVVKYVVVNPGKETRIRGEDLVFVMAKEEVQW